MLAVQSTGQELAIRARLADVAWEAGRLCDKRNWQMGVLAARTYARTRTGYDLRNKYTHGLAPDAEIASYETLSLSWLLSRVLLTPLLARAQPAEDAEGGNEGPEAVPIAPPEAPAAGEESVTSANPPH